MKRSELNNLKTSGSTRDPRLLPDLFKIIQLAQLFATTRVPGYHKDDLRTSAVSIHVVWAGERAFKVDILDSNCRVISKSGLQQQIQMIQADRSSSETRQNVASLSTSLSRNTWAERKARLQEREEASLDVLESAITFNCIRGLR